MGVVFHALLVHSLIYSAMYAIVKIRIILLFIVLNRNSFPGLFKARSVIASDYSASHPINLIDGPECFLDGLLSEVDIRDTSYFAV
jgi:hypothetical protein